MSFDSALSHEPADKRIEILRLVGESGSISQAARDAGVSYKAAWQAIDTLTNLAGVVLVERAVGGSGGGGASLTEAGQQLLLLAARLSETRNAVFESVSSDTASSRTPPGLAGIGVRTSMRNQWPCDVEKLEVRGQVVRVHLATAGPTPAKLVARITKASTELLGLQPGQAVLALCKATAVKVTPFEPAAGKKTIQSLDGHVLRISRSKTGDEVSLQLQSGLQLVGFATPGSAMKNKARVSAWVDEAAVVIALPS
ncbi:MAG: TOBE domain-containing protein [Pseudomonadota bacterium]